MKVSFVKKLRLALSKTRLRTRFLAAAFLVIYFFMLLGSSVSAGADKTEQLSDSVISVSGTVGYSSFLCTIMILLVSHGFVSIPFFKSMPLKKNDIIDVMILDILISVLVVVLCQSLCIGILNIYAVPYFICAYASQFALSMILMPIYMKNKSMYTNTAFSEDDGSRKRMMLRGAFLGLVYLAVSGTASVLIVTRGIKVCDPIADLPLLIGIFAASVLMSCILTAVCHRIENFGEN